MTEVAPNPSMPTESPSFLSYSRKDYYFAESLAFHLPRQGVPVGLDVRDLEPGKDWAVAAVVLCGYAMVMREEAIGRVLLVVAAPAAAFAWWSWRRHALGFWFLQLRAERGESGNRLAPARSWRTLIVFAVYLLAWYVGLGGST